jgi:hypothetical protein
MDIPLSEAIQQLRGELRQAVLDGSDQDIVFTPDKIEVELAVHFNIEAKAGGGFKLLTFLDVSVEGKASRERQHSIKLILSVADRNGKPLKVKSNSGAGDLPP